jgi:hypothetical protein
LTGTGVVSERQEGFGFAVGSWVSGFWFLPSRREGLSPAGGDTLRRLLELYEQRQAEDESKSKSKPEQQEQQETLGANFGWAEFDSRVSDFDTWSDARTPASNRAVLFGRGSFAWSTGIFLAPLVALAP